MGLKRSNPLEDIYGRLKPSLTRPAHVLLITVGPWIFIQNHVDFWGKKKPRSVRNRYTYGFNQNDAGLAHVQKIRWWFKWTGSGSCIRLYDWINILCARCISIDLWLIMTNIIISLSHCHWTKRIVLTFFGKFPIIIGTWSYHDIDIYKMSLHLIPNNI